MAGWRVDELLTSAQMRAVEQAAITAGRVTGAELMERAGAGVLSAVLVQWPGLATAPGRAAVICGPGNNGGDGYVLARLLHGRGWQVSVFALGDPARLPPDAAANLGRWRELGPVAPLEDFRPEADPPDLLLDALFGAGLARPVAGTEALAGFTALAADGAVPTRVVAVDAPSGLCMDSGRPLGRALFAHLTVSFHRYRPGHFLAEGPRHCGALALADIGLTGPGTPAAWLVTGQAGPMAKHPWHHKYAYGHALVLAGGPGRGGAARLAARAALRVGAGLVTIACPGAALTENAARLDAVMTRVVEDARDLEALLADPRLSAICLGPGLGTGERTRALVATAARAGRGLVLDADALTAFAGHAAELFKLAHPRCVLTPHGGEFARLFPDIAERLATEPDRGPAFSRLDAARMAAERAGAVVLLKGPDTVIAAPGGPALIHAAAYARAVPWLATAGAGDVLAGLITGLLARGVAPAAAAAQAAWLHAEAARAFGPGLIAEDLTEALPGVLARLLAHG